MAARSIMKTLTLACCLITTINAKAYFLRRQQSEQSLLCRLVVLETSYLSDNETAIETELTERALSCVPIYDNREYDDMFSIEIPDELLEGYEAELASGSLFVQVSNASIMNNAVDISANASFAFAIDRETRNTEIKSQLSVALVRISTADSAMSVSATELEDALFGDGVNFKLQFKACSFEQLDIISAGVHDISLSHTIGEFASPTDIVRAAQESFKAAVSVDDLTEFADRIMFCVPPGSGSWAASTSVSHWRMQFNDDFCMSLTAVMHEMGHTLGLLHSNYDGRPYGDRSGYMGSGTKAQGWPRKCYNGYQSHHLGWYKTRTIAWDPPQQGDTALNLAAFADFDKTYSNEPVIINIAEKYFLQFNRAKGMNNDTEMFPNLVTVSEPLGTGTEIRAAMMVGDTFQVLNFDNSAKTLIVEVCRPATGYSGSEMMRISIAMDRSLCEDDIYKGARISEADIVNEDDSDVPQSTVIMLRLIDLMKRKNG